jgi:hypothetical protein
MKQDTVKGKLQDIFNRIRDVKKTPLIGPQQLCVVGGRFSAAQLPKFIELWEPVLAAQMPWRIYEYVSRLSVKRSNIGIPLTDLNSLERARCFGEMGDLDLRRDLATIYWRFAGDPSIKLPDFNANYFKAYNYWTEQEENFLLRQFDTQTVQWRPDDGRVGDWKSYAGLVPEDKKNKLKVLLKQIHYVRAGRIELVRLTGFETEES